MNNNTIADRLIAWAFALLAITACALTLYPIMYILAVSFSSSAEIMKNNITLLPKGFTLAAYAKVLHMENVRNGIVNSILYTIAGTLLNLILTTALAYALSRRKLIGRKFLMILVTIPLFFSGGMIPTYIVIFELGMKDSIWAVILPWAVLSFYLILMKAFFEEIPDEIIESAAIDGANDFFVFVRIILPMSTTIIASIGLFYAIDNWNNFTNALLYLYKPEKFPLSLVLRNLLVAEGEMAQSNNSAEEFVAREAIQSATIILSMIPIMLVYPFLQKYFTQGIAMGALKG